MIHPLILTHSPLCVSIPTSVHAAVRYHHPEVVNILVACCNSRLDSPNAAGATYLTLAAAFGHLEICRVVATE